MKAKYDQQSIDRKIHHETRVYLMNYAPEYKDQLKEDIICVTFFEVQGNPIEVAIIQSYFYFSFLFFHWIV